jgi:hypothetical protein
MEAIELFQSDGRGTESGNRDANGPSSATASLREDYLGSTCIDLVARDESLATNQVQRDFLSQLLSQHP